MARIDTFIPFLRSQRTLIGLTALVGLGGFMRLFKLDALPPGLATTEAQLGLTVRDLLATGHVPTFVPQDGYSPLLVILEALPVHLLGATTWSLRLVPAIVGTLAIVFMWLWVRSWFGARIAWYAAFLLAVTPWAVTLTRNGSASGLMTLLVPLTLWLVTRAYRTGTVGWFMAVGLVLGIDLLAGPLGWLLVGLVGLSAVIWVAGRRKLPVVTSGRVGAFMILAALSGVAGYLIGRFPSGVASLPGQLGLPASPGDVISSIAASIAMFNLRGDGNFQHNMGGEPLLNIFVGLMFIAGLLVAMSKLTALRYRRLLLGFAAFMVPVSLSVAGAPDAARAAGLIPFTLIIAALGIDYMLGLWFSTFPINSAARTTGGIAIVLLLSLTALQGYLQYFHAWAGSAGTFAAFNEPAVASSQAAARAPGSLTRVFVGGPDELPVAQFLSGPQIRIAGVNDIMASAPAKPYRLYITSAVRKQIQPVLVATMPGGTLSPGLSKFDGTEIYYVYESAK